MIALYEAAARRRIKLIVQISARTEGGAADTPFLATKRSADAALENSGIPFVILRPAVVIGRNAHGGSALLRALAAFPCVLPLVHAERANAVRRRSTMSPKLSRDAIDGAIPPAATWSCRPRNIDARPKPSRGTAAGSGLDPAPTSLCPLRCTARQRVGRSAWPSRLAVAAPLDRAGSGRRRRHRATLPPRRLADVQVAR